MPYESERKLIVKIGRLLCENGLVAGTDGNLSILTEDKKLLITPSGVAKGRLHENDLILVNAEGTILSGDKQPSSELLMHLFVYKKRPDIMACCHAHPPYATAFSIVGKELPPDILPEVILSVGQIPLADYATPGTEAVPKSLEKHIDGHCAFMLRNHGVLTIGLSLEEAYNRMEIVEHFARIIYIAEKVGRLNHLDKDEVKGLKKTRDTKSQENNQ